MGMYNELNNIKRAVDQQAVEMKKTQEQQKRVEYVKNELDGLLWAELMENENIFDDEIKSIAIDGVVSNTDVLLYNIDYTRQYLNKRYYTIARQVEQIKKKTDEQTKKADQLKCDILEIKKQQEAEKLKRLQQKNTQREQVQQKNNINWGQIIGIIAGIIFLPVGLIILCIFAAAKNQK